MKCFFNSIPPLRKMRLIKRQFCLNLARYYCTEHSRNEWKCAVGLEIHAQLSTKSKLFSSALYNYATPTNNSVNLFDAAIPGTLPVLNKKAVELAVSSALALGCNINEISFFDRKHYFYPDMPAGYQITQHRYPIAENGKIEYAVYQPGITDKPYYKISKIKQIQLEQDSGRSLYDEKDQKNFIDLNRAGVALIEIVFHPDVETDEEACSLVKEVVRILQRVKSCSCKFDEGAIRVDANVSVSRPGENLGTRTEIKNIASIHGVSKAVQYEKLRQIKLLESGEKIRNETLMWDASLNKTVIMRDKEDSQDYRFMPEPNLPPLRLLINDLSNDSPQNNMSQQKVIDLRYLKNEIPITPQQDRINLIHNYGLNDVFAFNLVDQEKLLLYFKSIMDENPSRNPKTAYWLLMYQLLHGLNEKNIDLNDCPILAEHLGQIVDLLQKRRISKSSVEYLVRELLNPSNSLNPFQLVEKNNLEIISNPRELRKYCLKVVEREIALVAGYKKKKKTIFNLLVKKVIEDTQYRADTQVLPSIMTDVLAEKLDKDH